MGEDLMVIDTSFLCPSFPRVILSTRQKFLDSENQKSQKMLLRASRCEIGEFDTTVIVVGDYWPNSESQAHRIWALGN
jgi:hypothetical protein